MPHRDLQFYRSLQHLYIMGVAATAAHSDDQRPEKRKYSIEDNDRFFE